MKHIFGKAEVTTSQFKSGFGAAMFFAALLIFCAWPGHAEKPGYGPMPELTHLRVSGGKIVDANGSAVILRSVNNNQLGDYFQANPDVPSTIPLTKRDFEQMAAIGLDSVRLIVHWSLLEPERGVHDHAYLEKIRQAVDWARESGIYVILDMHQDAWGKYIAAMPEETCRWPSSHNIGWDGAPEWATITNDKSKCKLVQRELALAPSSAWKAFYEDRDGIQQHFVDTWAWLAGAFKHDPVVCGYDLLNEPNWGYNPRKTIRKQKPALYRRCVDAIRQAESGGLNKLIFFEPLGIWSAYPGEKPVVFTDDPNIVYAPHIYLGVISIDMFFFGRELIPLRRGFELADKESKVFGTTFYNGEWGPGPGDHGIRYAALEDEYQIGSARWQWKAACGDPHLLEDFWPDRSAVREGTMTHVMMMRCGDPEQPEGVEVGINPMDAMLLSRPYPRAFPAPAEFKSDPEQRTLEMTGNAPEGNTPLVVWIPGESEPEIKSENLGDLSLARVMGGWILSAAPGPGEWRLYAQGNH